MNDATPRPEAPHLVFVYGSLLSGLGNHRLLADARAVFLGRYSAGPGVRLLDLGPFPGMVRDDLDPHDATVTGELYRVDDATLEALDRLEGHPHFYRREALEVLPIGVGPTVLAWAYLLQRAARRDQVFVPRGDWRAHLATRGH